MLFTRNGTYGAHTEFFDSEVADGLRLCSFKDCIAAEEAAFFIKVRVGLVGIIFLRGRVQLVIRFRFFNPSFWFCLLYTSDAADE